MFQPFRLPTKESPLFLTTKKNDFRQTNGLCDHCENHLSNDGSFCLLYPIHEDIKQDDEKKFLAKNPETLHNFMIFDAMTILPNHGSLEGRGIQKALDKTLDDWIKPDIRLRVEDANTQAGQMQTTTVEILTPNGVWKFFHCFY